MIFSKSPKNSNHRELKPLPKSLVGLYGLIAVVIVLIPEWLAEFALIISQVNSKNKLPVNGKPWQTDPELRMAAMNFRELRNLAMRLKIHGYANESKSELSKRMLMTVQRRKINPF